MDSFKENTLKGHINLCELRYKALEEKIHEVEAKINSVESKVSELNKTMQSNFLEIKLAIERSNARRDVQIIASLGAVAVAIIGAVAVFIK